MYKVRKMILEDLDQILEIERICFSVPWSKDSFLLELSSPIAYYLTAVDDKGYIAGYGGMWCVAEEGNITNIGVRKECRRQGIASLILEGLLKYALIVKLEAIHLEVRESNLPALALYENYGFKRVGQRQGYYQKPVEDALLFSLFLKEEE